MRKGQKFWMDMWREGRIPFHKMDVNEDLITFWPEMHLGHQATVLVPLCGKSLDLMWISRRGVRVVGIELSELAIRQFFETHELDFQQEDFGVVQHYFTDSISLWCADIFNLNSSLISPVDAVYDRAALIALPEQLRPQYANRCWEWLKPGGVMLLKTLSYDQAAMEGPPFSVAPEEVALLYAHGSTARCLKSEQRLIDSGDSLFGRGLATVNDAVWLIRKD